MISTKGRYALRFMIDLAAHAAEGPIPLKDVAARQEISQKYLEIIVKDLVNAKLLTGARGKGGGYQLVKAPEDTSVGEILEATEGSLAPVSCLACDSAPCPRASSCPTLPLWEEYDRFTHDYFYGKRLTDLLQSEVI